MVSMKSASVKAAIRRQVMRPEARQSDLATIHLGKKALGWTEDEYRDIMATVCGGVRSAGDLDMAGRKRFIEHIQVCKRAGGQVTLQRRRPLKGYERKMWALWMQLADIGLVATRSMVALNAFSKRQTGVDSTEWLNQQQRELVIESLKSWLARGVEPKL